MFGEANSLHDRNVASYHMLFKSNLKRQHPRDINCIIEIKDLRECLENLYRTENILTEC